MILATVVLAALSFQQTSDAVVGVTAVHLESGRRLSTKGAKKSTVEEREDDIAAATKAALAALAE